jgi:hypothetical protein
MSKRVPNGMLLGSNTGRASPGIPRASNEDKWFESCCRLKIAALRSFGSGRLGLLGIKLADGTSRQETAREDATYKLMRGWLVSRPKASCDKYILPYYTLINISYTYQYGICQLTTRQTRSLLRTCSLFFVIWAADF